MRRDRRFVLRELSGSLGDLGTLFPLVVALVTVNGLDATAVLAGVGVAYMAAGLYFKIPLSVQPLKSMSAVAIALSLSGEQLRTAGLLFGLIVLALSLTPLPRLIGKLFSRPIIRGIQLAVGLLLVTSAVRLLGAQPEAAAGMATPVGHIGGEFSLSWLVAGAVLVILAIVSRRRIDGTLLAVIAVGVLAGLAFTDSWKGLGTLRLGIALPSLGIPNLELAAVAMTTLVLPQLPLTLANAVYASSDVVGRLYPDRTERVSPRSLMRSMGLVNVFIAGIGGMPVCHGSSGITAHHRFGARTGVSVAMLGAVLLAIALIFDGNVVPILALVPTPVLAALLALVGVQHAMLARDLVDRTDVVVCLTVGVVGAVTKNLALGFVLGLLISAVARAFDGMRGGAVDGRGKGSTPSAAPRPVTSHHRSVYALSGEDDERYRATA